MTYLIITKEKIDNENYLLLSYRDKLTDIPIEQNNVVLAYQMENAATFLSDYIHNNPPTKYGIYYEYIKLEKIIKLLFNPTTTIKQSGVVKQQLDCLLKKDTIYPTNYVKEVLNSVYKDLGVTTNYPATHLRHYYKIWTGKQRKGKVTYNSIKIL